MFRRKNLFIAATVCCLALTLGACGSGDGSAAGTGATSAVGPTGEPVAGGSARVMQLSEPRSMDPVTMTNAWQVNAFVGNALYGTLMINDKRTGEIEYTMAESFASSDRGATFELKLHGQLKFSDGTPLDAAAVKFNWDRHRDPAMASPYLPEASLIAATDVVDATTLKVTMTEPVPSFPAAMLTTSMNWIASPTALRKGKESFDAKPVGAGPYTLRSWTRQDRVELARNPGFWDAPRPYLDDITIRVSQESGQRYNTLVSGGADVVIETNADSIAKAGQAGYPTDVTPLSGGLFLAMNMRRAPFDDIRARQAIAAAVDLDALNDAVYNGAAQPVETLFTDSSPFYSETPLRTPDRAKAQRLFDELAAEGKPVTFTFTSFTSSEIRDTTENVQAQLSSFDNVKVQVKVVDFSEYPRIQASNDFDMLVWSANFLDPDPRLWTVFQSDSRGNFTGIKDARLDAALEAGRAAATEQERKAAYDTLQQRLIALVPEVFTVRVNPSVMAGKNVGGLTQYGFGSLLPERLWIQP